MTIQEAELIQNAKTPYKLNYEDGDEVSIISDTQMDPKIWSVMAKAAHAMGIEPTIALMPARDAPQAEPTDAVKQVMLESDLSVLVPSQALVHSDAAIEAQRRDNKLILMEEITPEILGGKACSADYDEILTHGRKIRKKWNEGSTATVTSPHGMDIEVGLEGRRGYFNAGKAVHQEDMDLYAPAFPDGEVGISPVEGTTNGTIVWDISMHNIGYFDEPIEADIEDGFVTDIRGGTEADQLRELLASYDNDDVYNLAEISIGINPVATITGIMRQDKKAWGFLHLAVGSNDDTGGSIEAPIHIDGIASECTLSIDGEIIVEDGDVIV